MGITAASGSRGAATSSPTVTRTTVMRLAAAEPVRAGAEHFLTAGDPVQTSASGTSVPAGTAVRSSSTAPRPIRASRPTTVMAPSAAWSPIVAAPMRSNPRSTEVVARMAPSLMTAPAPMLTRSGASISFKPRKAPGPIRAPSRR